MPFSEFFRLINRHDVYRKESFPEVFPEWWEVIKTYCPHDVIMGKEEPPFKDRTQEWLQSPQFIEEYTDTVEGIRTNLNGNGEKFNINGIALTFIFEKRRTITEKIYLIELYQMLTQRLGELSGRTILPDSTNDWIAAYLLNASEYASYKNVKSNADSNFKWLTHKATELDDSMKFLDDLVRTPPKHLVIDVSRASEEALLASLEEKYQ